MSDTKEAIRDGIDVMVKGCWVCGARHDVVELPDSVVRVRLCRDCVSDFAAAFARSDAAERVIIHLKP